LKKISWTIASPFKEDRHHRLISDSIGNNYSPTANDLSMKQLGKRLSQGIL
jgi:dynein heavy chain